MALLHVNFFSEVLGMCMNMDVILPQRTRGQIGMEGKMADGKYPTLYLLHGMSDDHTIWQRRTSIERYVAELGIAVVMPTVHLSFYTDMAHGYKYWTFVSEELPAICREFFPNMSDKREDTFVAGLSMGGYGAFKLGLGAADTFGKAASLSGALDMSPERFWEKRSAYWMDVFGDPEKFEGSENDLFALATRLKESGKPLPKLYAWCGTEDSLLPGNRMFREHAEKLGYDLTYKESEGIHSWEYWDCWIQDVLRWLMQDR